MMMDVVLCSLLLSSLLLKYKPENIERIEKNEKMMKKNYNNKKKDTNQFKHCLDSNV